MIKAFLILNTLIFVIFGAYAFLNPDLLAASLGANEISSDGLYELRGIYGGVSVGAGLLCLLGVLRTDMERPALYFLLAYTGGYIIARILALPLDGVPSPRLIGFSAFEAVTAALSVFLLTRRARAG